MTAHTIIVLKCQNKHLVQSKFSRTRIITHPSRLEQTTPRSDCAKLCSIKRTQCQVNRCACMCIINGNPTSCEKLAQEHSQVRDDDTIDGMGEIASLGDEGEIRIATLILITHVHPTIKHDVLSSHCHNHAALPHILPRPCPTNHTPTNSESSPKPHAICKPKNTKTLNPNHINAPNLPIHPTKPTHKGISSCDAPRGTHLMSMAAI